MREKESRSPSCSERLLTPDTVKKGMTTLAEEGSSMAEIPESFLPNLSAMNLVDMLATVPFQKHLGMARTTLEFTRSSLFQNWL